MTNTYIISGRRQQERDDGVTTNADGDQDAPAEPVSQQASRHLQDHVTPEEGRENHALDLHTPVESLGNNGANLNEINDYCLRLVKTTELIN